MNGRVRMIIACTLLLAAKAPAWGQEEQEAEPTQARVIHKEETDFGPVLVVDEGDLRVLRFGSVEGDDQSRIDLRRPERVPMDYVRDASLALAWVPAPQRVGMIGLGGGSFTNLIHRKLPGTEIHAVEISPQVARVAQRFFRVPRHPDYHIHIRDGSQFLKKTELHFDLLMLDAYDPEDMPSHMKSVFFFRLAHSRLTPEGLVLINLSLDEVPERVVARAFRQVFPQALCLRTKDGNNLLLFARASGKLEDGEALQALARQADARLRLPYRLVDIAARVKRKCP